MDGTTDYNLKSSGGQRQTPHGLTSKEVDLTEGEGRAVVTKARVGDEEEVNEGSQSQEESRDLLTSITVSVNANILYP